MKIYLSWSGELGRRASGVLRNSLEQLFPDFEIWSPGSDISAGSRWRDQIQNAMQSSELAIVCLTNDSRNSPWLLYEVGVMVGSSKKVIPWLVDMEFSDLSGPISQFQVIRSDAQSFHHLATSIHQQQSAYPLSQDLVARWALRTETEINQLLGRKQKTQKTRGKKEWLAQIEEAASSRNSELLQILAMKAETENISDRTILRALVDAYYDLRDSEGLINTFNLFQDKIGPDPKSYSQYAWALVRTAQTSKAISILEMAQAHGLEDYQLTTLLGRAYKERWREQLRLNNQEAAEESLRRAAETYTRGFGKYPNDFHIGLNAVQTLHLLGDSESVKVRNKLIPAVMSLAKKFVAKSGDKFWPTASLLELSVIRGEKAEAHQLAEKLRAKANTPWEIEATAQNIRLISSAKGFSGASPEWISDLVTKLTEEER